jgi:hypothetical protein
MVAMARNVGMVLGVSLAAGLLAIREPSYLSDALAGGIGQEQAAQQAFLHAAHDVFWVAAAICLLGALASTVRGTGSGHGPTA